MAREMPAAPAGAGTAAREHHHPPGGWGQYLPLGVQLGRQCSPQFCRRSCACRVRIIPLGEGRHHDRPHLFYGLLLVILFWLCEIGVWVWPCAEPRQPKPMASSPSLPLSTPPARRPCGTPRVGVKVGEASEAEVIQRLSRSPLWVWVAIDSATKLLLALDVGDRTLAMAQRLVHQVVEVLAPG